jgi:hypothetical protein
MPASTRGFWDSRNELFYAPNEDNSRSQLAYFRTLCCRDNPIASSQSNNRRLTADIVVSVDNAVI